MEYIKMTIEKAKAVDVDRLEYLGQTKDYKMYLYDNEYIKLNLDRPEKLEDKIIIEILDAKLNLISEENQLYAPTSLSIKRGRKKRPKGVEKEMNTNNTILKTRSIFNYNDFKRHIEYLGLTVVKKVDQLYPRDTIVQIRYMGGIAATVSDENIASISTDRFKFKELPYNKAIKLLNLLYEYSIIPIDQRHSE